MFFPAKIKTPLIIFLIHGTRDVGPIPSFLLAFARRRPWATSFVQPGPCLCPYISDQTNQKHFFLLCPYISDQTNQKYFFSPLYWRYHQVPTKITKGQIEITTEVFLVPKGQKVRCRCWYCILGGMDLTNRWSESRVLEPTSCPPV